MEDSKYIKKVEQLTKLLTEIGSIIEKGEDVYLKNEPIWLLNNKKAAITMAIDLVCKY